MAGHGKRQVSFQTKKTKGENQGGPGNDGLPSKKEKISKNSRNAAENQSYSFTPEIRPLISRERSFVRTRSNTAKEQASGSYHESGIEMQRQRSFVHPMQMQQQVREPHPHRRRSSMMPASTRGKPAMEIYRPPTLRGPCFFEPNGDMFFNGKLQDNAAMQQFTHAQQQAYNANQKQIQLNIHAKEFISGKNNSANAHLQHSKSNSGISQSNRGSGHGHPLAQSKSGHNLRSSFAGQDNRGPSPGSPPTRGVHFSDDKENQGEKNSRASTLSVGVTPLVGVKRSKSLGCGDFKEFFKGSSSSSTDAISPLADIGPFSQEITSLITNAYNDPSALSARHLMDIVRHLMTRVIEASRYAEPTARLCIAIIQNEKEETFLESLLNSCQEYFQERDRLLRSLSSSSQSNHSSTHPTYVFAYPKWIAYMSFLNEMYTQLKRRHVQLMNRRMRNSETAPGLLLLTLLAQCCSICLKEQSVNSLQEMECLFFVLTAIGKDIEVELPHLMSRVMASARDAFINTVKVPAVQKTLLQLIEMHAAGWNMPGPAVMYYYPGSGAK